MIFTNFMSVMKSYFACDVNKQMKFAYIFVICNEVL